MVPKIHSALVALTRVSGKTKFASRGSVQHQYQWNWKHASKMGKRKHARIEKIRVIKIMKFANHSSCSHMRSTDCAGPVCFSEILSKEESHPDLRMSPYPSFDRLESVPTPTKPEKANVSGSMGCKDVCHRLLISC